MIAFALAIFCVALPFGKMLITITFTPLKICWFYQ